jgi:hypothetical protein
MTDVETLKSLADSLDNNARQIHSSGEIIRHSIELAEDNSDAERVPHSARGGPHDGPNQSVEISARAAQSVVLERARQVMETARSVDPISTEAIYRHVVSSGRVISPAPGVTPRVVKRYGGSVLARVGRRALAALAILVVLPSPLA